MNNLRRVVVGGVAHAPSIMERLKGTDEQSSDGVWNATVFIEENKGHCDVLRRWAHENRASLRVHEDFPFLNTEDMEARFARAMYERGIAAYLKEASEG